jgi:hypothetical protein
MAVRAVTSAADSPELAASTAMTRHSGMLRPKLQFRTRVHWLQLKLNFQQEASDGCHFKPNGH